MVTLLIILGNCKFRWIHQVCWPFWSSLTEYGYGNTYWVAQINLGQNEPTQFPSNPQTAIVKPNY